MDQQTELVKIAAFYDELEKIAAQNPELYELLKQAGMFGFLGRGAARGASGIGRGIGRASTAINDMSLKGFVGAQQGLGSLGARMHHMPGGQALHTGIHAGSHGMGHAMTSSIDPSSILSHGLEMGGAAALGHAAVSGARMAAPAVGRLARNVGQGVATGAKAVGQGAKNLVGKLRPPTPPMAMATA